jgi:hypothetical protein
VAGWEWCGCGFIFCKPMANLGEGAFSSTNTKQNGPFTRKNRSFFQSELLKQQQQLISGWPRHIWPRASKSEPDVPRKLSTLAPRAPPVLNVSKMEMLKASRACVSCLVEFRPGFLQNRDLPCKTQFSASEKASTPWFFLFRQTLFRVLVGVVFCHHFVGYVLVIFVWVLGIMRNVWRKSRSRSRNSFFVTSFKYPAATGSTRSCSKCKSRLHQQTIFWIF